MAWLSRSSRARSGHVELTRSARTWIPVAVLGVASLVPAPNEAQDRNVAETIVSDRPGLGDGAHVLASGVWQMEVGLAVDGSDGRRLYSIGQAVLRIGLPAFELRVYPNSYALLRGDGASDRGFQDVGVGLKVPLSGAGGVRASLVAGATLPVGSDPFTADESTGFSTLVLEGSVSEAVALAVNTGYSFQFDDATDGALSLILTPAFPVSDAAGLSAYAGYAGFFNDGEDSHILEAGLAWLANPDTQLDLNGGWDTSSHSWFVGAGLALRWR